MSENDRSVARLSIPGEPVSKARARFTNYRSPARTYTPEKTRQAEETVAWHFRRAQPRWTPDEGGAFGVTAVFHAGTYQRRDVDNMLKLVLDACNGVVWKDDAQVIEVSGKKVLGSPSPRTEVVIYRVDADLTPTKACASCGRPFRVFKSTSSQKFCSVSCASSARRGRSQTCPQCGGEFSPGAAKRVCCSKECSVLYRNATVECSCCGKPFTRPRSWVRKSNYCSPECRTRAAGKRRAS